MIVVWEGNTARFGGITASAFAGICALAYLYDYHFNRTLSSICLSLFYAESCLSYGYDLCYSHIESTRPLSFRYDNPYGFFIDFLLIFCGRSLIDMTPTHFRIGMIMTAILLSR